MNKLYTELENEMQVNKINACPHTKKRKDKISFRFSYDIKSFILPKELLLPVPLQPELRFP